MSKKFYIQIWRWKKYGENWGINYHVFFQEEHWHILCTFPPGLLQKYLLFDLWFLLFFGPWI